MKIIKYIIIIFGILFFIAHQFDKKIQKSSDSNNNTTVEVTTIDTDTVSEPSSEQYNTVDKAIVDVEPAEAYYDNSKNCNFESDSDVLSYLMGKTFRQQDGSGYISFSSDGANLSGQRDYQWISYQTLGGFKGQIKLSSLDSSNPDGVLTLWVSCKENAVTDGNVVFMYN